MSKWRVKPTQKERGYAVLITFIITLAFIIFFYVGSLATSTFIPFSLLLGVSFMFFVPVACCIGVTRHRDTVYNTTGAYFCVLIIVAIIIVMLGIYYLRPP